ncbi:MAG: helix-turn-helix transcriptional regulator [Spirochaetes bacterium]|nr:MAG: helix-turn-helix transcriptional regulator [Spirochaetota bacterium]
MCNFDLKSFGITPREKQVLKALVTTRGTNREIAERLGLHETTVKTHIYNICNKIGVDSRIDLIELCRWNWEC